MKYCEVHLWSSVTISRSSLKYIICFSSLFSLTVVALPLGFLFPAVGKSCDTKENQQGKLREYSFWAMKNKASPKETGDHSGGSHD